jgi:hypothetical protein
MSNESFKRNFAAYLKKVGDKANSVVQKTVIDMGGAMVQKSPVDIGRFKGNWQYGNGSINFDTSSAPDKTGNAAITKIIAGVSGWKPGQTMYITNSLPYAKRLEYDAWSKQAAAGMVRVTVAEFSQAIRRAAQAAK